MRLACVGAGTVPTTRIILCTIIIHNSYVSWHCVCRTNYHPLNSRTRTCVPQTKVARVYACSARALYRTTIKRNNRTQSTPVSPATMLSGFDDVCVNVAAIVASNQFRQLRQRSQLTSAHKIVRQQFLDVAEQRFLFLFVGSNAAGGH